LARHANDVTDTAALRRCLCDQIGSSYRSSNELARRIPDGRPLEPNRARIDFDRRSNTSELRRVNATVSLRRRCRRRRLGIVQSKTRPSHDRIAIYTWHRRSFSSWYAKLLQHLHLSTCIRAAVSGSLMSTNNLYAARPTTHRRRLFGYNSGSTARV